MKIKNFIKGITAEYPSIEKVELNNHEYWLKVKDSNIYLFEKGKLIGMTFSYEEVNHTEYFNSLSELKKFLNDFIVPYLQ